MTVRESIMRIILLSLTAAACCFAASANAVPSQGSVTTISGPAHVEHEATGTRIFVNNPDSIVGFVPWGQSSTFAGLERLDGHDVEITGVVDAKRQITL